MNGFKIKILAVDDDPVALTFLANMIQKYDYVPLKATNGEEALAVLDEHDDIDLIILDRMMPVMDGVAFMKAFKERESDRHIPVIMQTAAGEQQDIAQGISTGVYYYLVKPFDEDVLVSLVKGALHDYSEFRQTRDMLNRDQHVHHLMRSGVFEFRTVEDAQCLAFVIADILPNKKDSIFPLQELLVNAIEHGNLGLTYDEKKNAVLNGTWHDELEKRLAMPEFKDKRAVLSYYVSDDQVMIRIKDEGQGFDWKKFVEVSAERLSDPSGRGIAMAHLSGAFQIHYKGCGNEVTCTIDL